MSIPADVSAVKNDPKHRFVVSSLAVLLLSSTTLALEDDPKASHVPIPNTIGAYDETDGPAQRNALGGISEGVVLRGDAIPLSGLGNAISGSDCWGYVFPLRTRVCVGHRVRQHVRVRDHRSGSPQEVGFISGPAIGTASRCTKTTATW